MGIALTDDDEGLHAPGDQINWNESRYVDVWDPIRRTGGWFRIGARPNANYAEMSACLYLPDGRTAFAFDRAEIDGNSLSAGGRSGTQAWEIGEPWRTSQVSYDGTMSHRSRLAALVGLAPDRLRLRVVPEHTRRGVSHSSRCSAARSFVPHIGTNDARTPPTDPPGHPVTLI